jgi:S1-C subfamily serine protease
MKNGFGLTGKTVASGAALLVLLLVAAPAFAGWLGIGVGDITSERVSALKLKEERGVEILSVVADSPAAQAGLKEHDVVLEYNGQAVESVEQFQRLVRETPAGRVAKLVISRDGKTQTLTAKLGEPQAFGPGTGPGAVTVIPPGRNGRTFTFNMPELPRLRIQPRIQPPSNLDELRNWSLSIAGPRIGVETEELSGQLADYFGLTGNEGLLVRSVESGGAAEKAGIKAGDVITKVNGVKVTTASGLRAALRDNAGKGEAPITLMRSRKEMTLTVKIEAPSRRLITPARGQRV